MASIIAHEAEEAVTDPDLNAWYDNRGAENADKCAWTFGTTSTATNGSLYNMTLGVRRYLIQQTWNAGATQACHKSYPWSCALAGRCDGRRRACAPRPDSLGWASASA